MQQGSLIEIMLTEESQKYDGIVPVSKDLPFLRLVELLILTVI